MKLTDQQMNHFKSFGFLTFRQYLTPDELKTYSDEFDAALEARRMQLGGDVKRVWTTLMDANTPFIASLIDDPRFADVAKQVLGGDPIGIVTDGNYYVGDTGWHPDTGTCEYRAAKFVIYLDELDASNGALRVIPGSHRDPLYSQLQELLWDRSNRGRKSDLSSTLGIGPDEVPAFSFVSEPGDALLFNNAIWHAAFGGGDRRRMGTVIYYENPQTPESVANTQLVMGSNHRKQASEWGEQFYPEYWRSTDDPRHQRWVRRLDELEILKTPLTQS